MHFAAISRWIQVCNITHQHTNNFMAKLPRRVVGVGIGPTSSVLRLYDTKGCAIGRYVTLSHRWGEGSEKFRTTRANLDNRQMSINMADLPKSFQDSIRVTRNLGVQFIWIDSVCIVQDDDDDWSRESVQMEEIYSLSYCTIAVTSATDLEGFLYRSPKWFEKHADPDNSDLGYRYTYGDSFDEDVDQSLLNRRGWVLQERVLSRRTIHSTERLTYWECGSATCSEISDACRRQYTPPNNAFLQASDFLKLTPKMCHDDLKMVFTKLFANYSAMGLTVLSDRPVAIAGLEYRLSDFYDTPSVYGIIQKYFRDSLIWARARSHEQPIPLVNFESEDIEREVRWARGCSG